MSVPPAFERDLAELPTSAFGARSLTWCGVVGYMVIEGVAFAMAIAAFFFLMAHEQSWPPEPWLPPNLLAGTLFTLLILVSEIPNSMLKRAAEKQDLARVRKLILLLSAIGIPLLILRAFEFDSLNIRWTDNAYGSVLWMLLFLHSLHIGTDWVDTLVLTALMHTEAGKEPRRFVDTSENSLYWRFVWLSWLPIYFLIYLLPRLA